MFTIPFDSNEDFSFTQLLVRAAQQTHRLVPPRGAGRPGRGSGTWACVPRRWGARQACGRQPVLRGWCGGPVDSPTVRDSLAAVNDGVPANAVVMRPAIGFEMTKDAGSPLILTVVQDPGGVPV